MSSTEPRSRGPPALTEEDEKFVAVQAYLDDRTIPTDDVLALTHKRCRDEGLPAIAVSQSQGVLLEIITRTMGAKRVLEIGALGGYSAIHFGRALPADGQIDTIEISEHHAKVAKENLERAGLADRVKVHVGAAYDLLQDRAGPFASRPAGVGYDLVFIDANKEQSKEYFIEAQRLTRPGGVIIVDNVARHGSVLPKADETPSEQAVGIRRLLDHIHADGGRTIQSSVTQTVSDKGWDGFLLAYVKER